MTLFCKACHTAIVDSDIPAHFHGSLENINCQIDNDLFIELYLRYHQMVFLDTLRVLEKINVQCNRDISLTENATNFTMILKSRK